ncbi:MAG: tetratricopeptide repeat-containing sensor histidine kinase [Breznakibacter sp.]|nr:tetratricopeptide repeat-containing sensor histidine kinase [Breznakibacter sp.]
MVNADNPVEGHPFLMESLKYFKDLDYTVGEGYAYFLLATCYQKQLQADSALFHYENAKLKLIAGGDTIGLLSVYNNLGNHVARMGNMILAEQNFAEAEGLFSKPSHLSVLVMYNIANFRLESGNSASLSKVKASLLQLLQYDDFLDSLFLSDIYNSLAATEIRLDCPNSAIDYAQKSIGYMPNAGIVDLQDQYLNLANSYLLAGNEADFKVLMQEINLEYADLEAKNQKQYQYLMVKAFLGEMGGHLDEYLSLTSVIQNTGFSDKMLEIKKSFEVKEKQAQIDMLAKDNEIQKTHIRFINWVAAISFVFVLAMALLVLLLYRERTRLRRSQAALFLEQQKTELANEELANAIRIKDRLMSVIAHDLRGPLGGMKELIELYSDMPELDPVDVKHFFAVAKDSSASVYFLLENLLVWANNQKGKGYFSPIEQNIVLLVQDTIDCLKSWAGLKNIQITVHSDKSVIAKVDGNMFKTIVRNLVSNSIKYSDSGKDIVVYIECDGREVVVSVIDQGKGIDAEVLPTLFQKQDDMLDRSLSDNKVGLGLVLCSDFTGKHNGRIWAESQIERGTKVTVAIPVDSYN